MMAARGSGEFSENRQNRGSALRRRLAGQFVSEITTDEGIVGWSEYMEGYGAPGLTGVIQKIGQRLIGQDPRPVERISALLYAATRQAAGGINQMAIAAIENALVDIEAKALGVPVYE